MCDYVHTCGKALAIPAKHNGGDFRLRSDVRQRQAKLFHHCDVDHIDWRILQRYARERRLAYDIKTGKGWRSGSHIVLVWTRMSEPHGYRLIADFLGSAMVSNGSRAPSFGTIHFFSFAMISSNSFLSSGVGMNSQRRCSYSLSSSGSPLCG